MDFYLLKKCYRNLVQIIHKYYVCFLSKYRKDVMDNPYQVVYIPTNLIKMHIVDNNVLPSYRHEEFLNTDVRIVGKIFNCPWDREKIEFNNTDHYIAFKERFIDNKEWEDTRYYIKFKYDIKEKGVSRGIFDNWNEFKSKCLTVWENIYFDIKKNGYKSQSELNRSGIREIEICISSKGEVLFIDGRHRLSMAKLAGIDKVPVIVNLWHKDFIQKVLQETNYKKLTPSLAIKYIKKYEIADL